MTTADTAILLDRNVYADGYVEPPRNWKHWVAATATLVLLCGAIVGVTLWGMSNLMTPTPADASAESPEAIILGGQAPAVAATAGGRIIDVGCMVTGPVEVAADGTGAFVVTGGGSRVVCPQEPFRTGLTLRWPDETTPDTVPTGGPGPVRPSP